MKHTRKILLAGLCTALYFSAPTAFAATEDPTMMAPAAQQRVPVRFAAPQESQTKCGSCWNGFGRCLKKTKGYLAQVRPVLEIALTLIDDEKIQQQGQVALKLLAKGMKHVDVDDQGNIKFLKGEFEGQTLANALLLVVNDKSKLLTDESVMTLSVVLSSMSEGNWESKMRFVGFLAASDDPQTDYHITFNKETGHVGLRKGTSALPFEHVPLFEENMADEIKETLRGYFAEYVPAVNERTAAEAANGGGRSDAHYLPETGNVRADYKTLIETNPNFRLIEIAEEVIQGDTSAIDVANAVGGLNTITEEETDV